MQGIFKFVPFYFLNFFVNFYTTTNFRLVSIILRGVNFEIYFAIYQSLIFTSFLCVFWYNFEITYLFVIYQLLIFASCNNVASKLYFCPFRSFCNIILKSNPL